MDKGFRKIIISVIAFYGLLVIFAYLVSGLSDARSYMLDDNITVEIYRNNGEHEVYDSNIFPAVNRADTVIAHIKIPDELKINDPTLCVRVYNSVFQLTYDKKQIFTYGSELASDKQQIGIINRCIQIPDETFGKEVQLGCYVQENNAFNRIDNVMLVSSNDTMKWYLGDKVAEFLFFFTVMAVSIIVFLILLFSDIKKRQVRMGIWLTLFSAVLSCYILAGYGMTNIFISNDRLAANLKYYTKFILPVPLLAYYAEFVHGRRLKKIMTAVSGVYFLFAVICNLLNRFTVNYHFCQLEAYCNTAIIFGLIIVIAVSIYEKRHSYDSKVTAANGIIIFAGILLLEIIRQNIVNSIEHRVALLEISLLPIGVILLIIMLFVQCLSNAIHIYDLRCEEEHLKKIAYLDGLTGLVNRTGCQQYFDSLKNENKKDYTLIFLDLNNLKDANDNYGHIAGDNYIKNAAVLFNNYFRTAGLCGRYGGDEFVVVYTGKIRIHISSVLERINKDFEDIQKKENNGYNMSVSGGAAYSTKAYPLSIEEALSIADKRMYEYKNNIKKACQL